jgi:hypothetical protein
VRANVAFSATPLGVDRMDFHGTLEQIGEDVAKARQVGAAELFFDLWTGPIPRSTASTTGWRGWSNSGS